MKKIIQKQLEKVAIEYGFMADKEKIKEDKKLEGHSYYMDNRVCFECGKSSQKNYKHCHPDNFNKMICPECRDKLDNEGRYD